MAQDAEREDELEMVTLFSSSNVDAEMEANNIHTILQASGIPSVVVGSSVIPSLEFQVQVPRESVEEANALIAEAQAAGPQAAAEAEAATEEP
jgi:hypothetical protein